MISRHVQKLALVFLYALLNLLLRCGNELECSRSLSLMEFELNRIKFNECGTTVRVQQVSSSNLWWIVADCGKMILQLVVDCVCLRQMIRYLWLVRASRSMPIVVQPSLAKFYVVYKQLIEHSILNIFYRIKEIQWKISWNWRRTECFISNVQFYQTKPKVNRDTRLSNFLFAENYFTTCTNTSLVLQPRITVRRGQV